MKAGASKFNITPPLGINIAGTFTPVFAHEILDDLFVHALVLDDGSTEIAILSVDVCSLNTEFVYDRILPLISEHCGIPVDHIMIGATHTHSGPVLHTTLTEIFGQVSESYVGSFVHAAVNAVAAAKNKKVHVRAGGGKGMNPHHVFNRRLKKPDGSIVMNFVERGFLRDCIPAGVVDPEIIVLRFDDDDGNPIALVVNYANHNNTFCGVDVISSSISGYLEQILEKVYGSNLVTLFLLGACGNTNWVDHEKEGVWTDRSIHKKIATGLAGNVLQLMPVIECNEIDHIGIAWNLLEILDRPYRGYDTFEDDTFGRGPLKKDFFDGYRADQDKYGNLPLAVNRVPIGAVTIGSEMAIVTNPAELFTEMGIEIKANSPFPFTIVSELTNGSCGYVPTLEAYEEGGYEVRKIQGGSFLAQDAGRRIVAASREALTRLNLDEE